MLLKSESLGKCLIICETNLNTAQISAGLQMTLTARLIKDALRVLENFVSCRTCHNMPHILHRKVNFRTRDFGYH